MRCFGDSSHFRGQGLVEFALVLPIFLLLTFGIIEMGWLVYSNHTLTNATREGARYAMVNGERSAENSGGSVADANSVRPVIEERAGQLGGNINSVYVNFSPDPEPGSEVTVRTTYNFEPIVGTIVGIGAFQLSSESTVIVQY